RAPRRGAPAVPEQAPASGGVPHRALEGHSAWARGPGHDLGGSGAAVALLHALGRYSGGRRAAPAPALPGHASAGRRPARLAGVARAGAGVGREPGAAAGAGPGARAVAGAGADRAGLLPRSEEHTSELQSRENLVCRLLLEKKKTA